MDINISEIMISTIAGVVVTEVWNFIKRKYAETLPIKKLSNIKIINILGFTLAYIFPLVVIVSMIIDHKTEPNFLNISLFIVICVLLVYNIIMRHILKMYDMFSELIKKTSNNDSIQVEAINDIFKILGKENKIT